MFRVASSATKHRIRERARVRRTNKLNEQRNKGNGERQGNPTRIFLLVSGSIDRPAHRESRIADQQFPESRRELRKKRPKGTPQRAVLTLLEGVRERCLSVLNCCWTRQASLAGRQSACTSKSKSKGACCSLSRRAVCSVKARKEKN